MIQDDHHYTFFISYRYSTHPPNYKMSLQFSIVLILSLVGCSWAFTAEFIPKSYYVIHDDGEQSPTVYFREKRSLQEPLLPLMIRMRRSEGSGSGSYSSSSSFSGSGAGGGGDAIFFADNLKAGLDTAAKLAGFPNGFPTHGNIPPYVPGGGAPCDNCGGYGAGGHDVSGAVPNLLSRFGGDEGASYSGTAPGAKGVFSSSSSAIDGDGNVKYSVKAGKF